MDIDLLSKIIKELILDTDEVSLPGVGTFVAEIVPSTFSDKGYTINPPYRRLSFRQRQTEEDTMLSDFYAASNNLDKASAQLIINDFLRELKEVLKERKTIIFPGLGRLRATKENNFFFVADEDLDIYPAGFGLEAVSLKTHEETPEAVSAAISNLRDMIETPVTAATPADEEAIPAEVQTEEVQTEEVQTEEVQTVEETNEEAESIYENEQPVQHKSLLEEADYYVSPYTKTTHKPIGKELFMVALWTIIAVVAFLAIFVLLAHIAPDFIDSILYSKEELEILRTPI